MNKRFKPARNRLGLRIPVIFEDKPLDIPVSVRPDAPYAARDFDRHRGQWIEFKTPWGKHRGIVESVQRDRVLVKMPKQYATRGLLNYLRGSETDVRPVSFDGFDDGCVPFRHRGPWCWCWLPIIIILFIFPWFCW
ncbi:hypothetical protein GCM10025857_10000 [Alicyclobacillus contaminans]|uniref:hypothetical protein n=1 Tax=Alicyclobacillus contaminans TaxID=392016 RepID=UPI0004797F35|nr:hypothetical protein [Alicyclobacillus contaminans]GMA49643.1 hypothetical protein GCM10025857_10000 [Alicyclobacillus contaminans]